ncbi:uncharacterized protein TNCV_2177661 [Trichonephila clavipes]|uniref:Uncharacterized protein n=1 Tax=Trichonephila clavipes TaxID=2585209 RepID=A0A8X6VU72_TRICX|nr:uncharacterized protein TNCV_2177661 [Trichonephila clavipes]
MQENWRDTRVKNRYHETSRQQKESKRFGGQGVGDNRRFDGRRQSGQSDHRFNNHGGRQGGSRNGAFRGQNGQGRISSSRMTPVDLPYVPSLLNEMFITALWDTGPEKQYISEVVHRRYFLYQPHQRTKNRVVTAQGAPCFHSGRVELQIRIQDFQKTWEFNILDNMQYQCILGIDFMKDSRLTLDFDKKSLVISDAQIKQLAIVEKPVEKDLSDTKLALRALALNSREQLIKEQWEVPELDHIYRYLENLEDGSVNATVCEGRIIITPFRKLVQVTDGAEYVGGNIEKLFDEVRQNMQRQHKTWEKYYNRKRRAVNIKVNDLVLVQTHIISAVGRKVVGKFMPKFEGPYRVLEVQNNNLNIWKRRRRVTVNVNQLRIYHPRNSETSSFDSINDTAYEGKESSNWSNRSNSENSRRSRKPSGNENKSCNSDKGNAILEDVRVNSNKAVESTGTSMRYDGKRQKICRKRSFRGSDYEQYRKRKAPVLLQGLKRGIPSSIYSRSHKLMRKDIKKHTSQEPEIFPGTSNQGQTRRSNPPKPKRSRKIRTEADKTRETRPSTNREHSADEGRPVRSRKKTTVRPCPYYLRRSFKEPEGLPEEQRSMGIDSLLQNSLRRRRLSMEAVDRDPAEIGAHKKIRVADPDHCIVDSETSVKQDSSDLQLESLIRLESEEVKGRASGDGLPKLEKVSNVLDDTRTDTPFSKFPHCPCSLDTFSVYEPLWTTYQRSFTSAFSIRLASYSAACCL